MHNGKAFTILEIVIAIALIAIFITLPVLAYNSYLKKTRDTQRKNSINQIQSALEQYRANNGKYPAADTWKDTLVAQSYIPSVPKDPLDGQAVTGEQGVYYGFDYTPTADLQSYELSAHLEDNSGGGAGEVAYYTVTPEGPKTVYVTPGPTSGGGGGPPGTGSGNLLGGALSGDYAPTGRGGGSGTITSGTILFTGTVSNGIFTGTFSGTTNGTGGLGTISGSYTGPTSGTISGSVTGTGFITDGTNTTTTFTANFGDFILTPVTPTSGVVSNTPIPTSTGLPTSAVTQTLTPSPTLVAFWSKSFAAGGGGIITEEFDSVQATTDGGALIAGMKGAGYGLTDIYLTKVNTYGQQQWTKVIGTSSTETANIVKETTDSGYIVGAKNASSYPTFIKLNASRVIQWTTTVNISSTTGIKDLQEVSDGYVGVANTSTGIHVIKVLTSGAISWKYIFGTNSNDKASAIEKTADNGFVIVGDTSNYSVNRKILLFKINSSGSLSWAKTFGAGSSADVGADVVETASGIYVLTAYFNTPVTGLGNTNSILFKYNANTDTITWSNAYGGGNIEQVAAMKKTADGGFVTTGYIQTLPDYIAKLFIAKFNSSGALQWSRMYDTTDMTFGLDITETSAGHYVAVGDYLTNGVYRLFALKADSNGDMTGCTAMTNGSFTTVAVTPPVAVITLGAQSSGSGAGTSTFSQGSGGSFTNMCP